MRQPLVSITVLAGVLLGVIAVGFLAISGLVASDPPPEPNPSQTATVPTAIPKDIPVAPSGEQATVPTSKTTQSEREQPPKVDRSTAVATVGQNESTVYMYRDGDREVRVLLQGSLTVLETEKVTADDIVIHRSAENSIVEKQTKHGSDAPPVFRSESDGGLMALPGGVLLALDPSWSESEVEQFFKGNGISESRVSPLGYIPNGFAVETDPGFPSLEIANTLAQQDGVAISSPNWWRETEAK